MPADRAQALALIQPDAQLERRLDIYVDLLSRWRKITNLISEATFHQVWTRHIADSAQLLNYAPGSRRWVDMGSGAGFPGIVIAIQLADLPGAQVHCIESDKRKCAFLREVARATGAPARVHAARVENIDPESLGPVDAVTSRALAPLPKLIEFANVWLSRGAIGIFPRGRTAEAQIEALSFTPPFHIESFPSELDPEARIVRVRGAEQASP
jgi:16S rRNA (guanine527-N7)-methyltransferase